MKLQGAILLVVACITPSLCFMKWFFNGDSSDSKAEPEDTKPVSFEMKTADETFLMEGTNGLSELDFCHHRVISELHSTCSDLNEEGLAKLSVQLLNCQLDSEDRETYACTDDMAIKECTKSMDATMWNAYQIVSNRARAICYSVRQQHFRLKTEYTVNKLVHNTHEQIEAMQRIQSSQEKINELTGTTMEHLQTSQKALVDQHDNMQASAAQMQRFIAGNLQALTQEKALIASGNKALHDATEKIQDKLDNTMETMKKQEEMQKQNQEVLLEDLAEIQGKARRVFDKLDDSSKNILKYHAETTLQYETTLENLNKVNVTVNSVLNTIYSLQQAFDRRLEWISSVLGEADNKVEIIVAASSHVLYFIVVGVTCAMLNTPVFSRFVLLTLVPLNAWSQVRKKPSLGFNALTFLITAVVIVNWILSKLLRWWQQRGTKVPSVGYSEYTVANPAAIKPSEVVSPEDLRRVISVLQQYAATLSVSPFKGKKLDYEETTTDTIPEQKVEKASEPEKVANGKIHNTDTEDTEDTKDIQHEEEEENLKESESVEGSPANTPDDEEMRNFSVPQGSIKNRADQIKRQLMRSPASPIARNIEDSLENSRPSRASTPNKSPRSRPRIERARTPSFSRPLCTASTKTGQPCRLTQKDDTLFCYRHQGNQSFME